MIRFSLEDCVGKMICSKNRDFSLTLKVTPNSHSEQTRSAIVLPPLETNSPALHLLYVVQDSCKV
jgi:hypothetical protein